MSRAEIGQYDICGVILSMSAASPSASGIGAHSRAMQFAAECSNEVAKVLGREPRAGAIFLPSDVMTRALTTSSGQAGGFLVGTDNDLDFASALRSKSVIPRLPMRHLRDLQSNVTIPRGNANASVTWLATEASQAQEGDPTFGQISMTAHTCTAVVDLSRTLLNGMGPRARSFVEAELGGATGQGVDVGFIAGTGASGQPSGILSAVAGIDGTSFAWADACAMLKTAETYGPGESIAWIAGVSAAEKLRQRERAAGSGFILDDDRIASRPAMVTNAAPADSLLVGPWDSVVMGEWGGMEIMATGFASAAHFRAGLTTVRLMWTVDFAARQPASFAKSESIT